jgi:simple sugar transport system ATP-binding protein
MTSGDSAPATEPRIELLGITRRFGKVTALNDVSLRLRQGSVHALLGENGAGKTTLMRVAFGLLSPDQGTVRAGGRAIESAQDAIRAGIGMVHQHFTNVPAMTVAENVALGGRGRLRAHEVRARVLDSGRRTGLVLDPNVLAGALPVGAQQRLEIVKSLARDAHTLILDEPSAVLAPREASELLTWIRAFADHGGAVVLVTHRLAEALQVADEISVLRRGELVLHAGAATVDESSLTRALLGDDDSERGTAPHARASAAGAAVLTLTGLDAEDERGVRVVRDVSLSVAAGEILGVAAVEGSGHRELLRIIAGRAEHAHGVIERPPVIGFVPEDRQRDALALEFSLTENVALLGAGARRGRLSWRTLGSRAEALVRAFDIRAASVAMPARALSGGNQQKLVLARELSAAPRLLVAENPTRGLDIRAARAVHERLRDTAADGAAVVVYSSDLDEVLSLATRVLVMHGGRARECAVDRDEVGRAMLGVA